jgi:hypothetical protein
MTSTNEAVASNNWFLSIEIFFLLQVFDVMTTWLGFRVGLAEASPFIQYLMHFGTLAGLLGSKLVAFGIGGYCVWRRRFSIIRVINYWYGALVLWNLALILSR